MRRHGQRRRWARLDAVVAPRCSVSATVPGTGGEHLLVGPFLNYRVNFPAATLRADAYLAG